MRELVLAMSMSVDGFVAGPRGEIDWIFHGDEHAKAWKVATVSQAGLHLMGSRTFRDMAAFWPTASGPFAAPMNDIPKAVVSRRAMAPLATGGASWREAYVARGDLADEIGALKRAGGGPIVAHGGAGLARSLIALGLIDRFALLVHPVALGSGLPIFSALPAPAHLDLQSIETFPSGAMAQTWRLR